MSGYEFFDGELCPKCGSSDIDDIVIDKDYSDGSFRPVKDKTIAGILAILLGGFGVHKFYMGKNKIGILYILLCWTSIPSIIGIVEGIIYLTHDDLFFQNRVNSNTIF